MTVVEKVELGLFALVLIIGLPAIFAGSYLLLG